MEFGFGFFDPKFHFTRQCVPTLHNGAFLRSRKKVWFDETFPRYPWGKRMCGVEVKRTLKPNVKLTLVHHPKMYVCSSKSLQKVFFCRFELLEKYGVFGSKVGVSGFACTDMKDCLANWLFSNIMAKCVLDACKPCETKHEDVMDKLRPQCDPEGKHYFDDEFVTTPAWCLGCLRSGAIVSTSTKRRQPSRDNGNLPAITAAEGC